MLWCGGGAGIFGKGCGKEGLCGRWDRTRDGSEVREEPPEARGGHVGQRERKTKKTFTLGVQYAAGGMAEESWVTYKHNGQSLLAVE